VKKEEIYKRVENYLYDFINENGFEIVDIEFVKECNNNYLRVFINKQGGVTISDCQITSRFLEKKLDEEDIIDGEYILEVSSPGLDRNLKKEKDFIDSVGKIVDIKLYRKNIDKKKEFQGELIGLIDGVITIIDEEGITLSFEKKDVASIRLAVIF